MHIYLHILQSDLCSQSGEQPHPMVTRKVTQNTRPSFSQKSVLTWSRCWGGFGSETEIIFCTGLGMRLRLHSALVWVWDWDYILQWFWSETEITFCSGLGMRLRLYSALVWVWDWDYILQWFGSETETTFCSGLGLRLWLHSAVVWVWDCDYILQWFGSETEITFYLGWFGSETETTLTPKCETGKWGYLDWCAVYQELLAIHHNFTISSCSKTFSFFQSSVYVHYTTWK